LLGTGPFHVRGEAVKVEPIKPVLKVPGSKRLKLNYGELLSSIDFNFNLCRYNVDYPYAREVGHVGEAAGVAAPAGVMEGHDVPPDVLTGVLHWLQKGGQGLTLVHFSAQPEPFPTQNIPYIPPNTPTHHTNTP
jgi:hypothetical protein